MDSPEIQALARNALQAVGGYAVAHGLATNDQATAIIGGIVALAAVAWSVWQKRQQRRDIAVALATPLPVGTPTAPQSQPLVDATQSAVQS